MPGEPPKTHQRIFAEDVLPDLFHTTPEQFLALLNRDGTRFLYFYWETAGKSLPAEARAGPFGLNYVFPRLWRKDAAAALILLPKPASEGEAYFSALVYRPYRRLLLVSDTTAVFNLEMAPGGTRLVSWTHRGEREELQAGVEPAQEAFFQAVLDQVRD